MSAEENAALAKRWIAVWDEGDLSKMDDLYAAEFEYYMRWPALEAGVAGEKQFLKMMHEGFPDPRIIAEDLIVDERKAVVRWDAVNRPPGLG